MATYDYLADRSGRFGLVERAICSCSEHVAVYVAYDAGRRIRHGDYSLPELHDRVDSWVTDATCMVLPRSAVRPWITWDSAPLHSGAHGVIPKLRALCAAVEQCSAQLYRYGSSVTQPGSAGDLDLLLSVRPGGLSEVLAAISSVDGRRGCTDEELLDIFTVLPPAPVRGEDLLHILRQGLPYFFLGDDRVDLMIASDGQAIALPHDDELGPLRTVHGIIVGSDEQDYQMPRSFRIIDPDGRTATVRTMCWYLPGMGALSGRGIVLDAVRAHVTTDDVWFSARHSRLRLL